MSFTMKQRICAMLKSVDKVETKNLSVKDSGNSKIKKIFDVEN